MINIFKPVQLDQGLVGIERPRIYQNTAVRGGATSDEITTLTTAVNSKISNTEKGASNGVMPLDSNAEPRLTNSAKGFILKDRTNGNSYRLYFSGGVLLSEIA